MTSVAGDGCGPIRALLSPYVFKRYYLFLLIPFCPVSGIRVLVSDLIRNRILRDNKYVSNLSLRPRKVSNVSIFWSQFYFLSVSKIFLVRIMITIIIQRIVGRLAHCYNFIMQRDMSHEIFFLQNEIIYIFRLGKWSNIWFVVLKGNAVFIRA